MADPTVYGDKEKFLAAEADYKKANAALTDTNKLYEKVFEQMMEWEEKME